MISKEWTRIAVEAAEKSRLVPSVPHVAVGDEDRDKLSARIDRTLEGNYRDGIGGMLGSGTSGTGRGYCRSMRHM